MATDAWLNASQSDRFETCMSAFSFEIILTIGILTGVLCFATCFLGWSVLGGQALLLYRRSGGAKRFAWAESVLLSWKGGSEKEPILKQIKGRWYVVKELDVGSKSFRYTKLSLFLMHCWLKKNSCKISSAQRLLMWISPRLRAGHNTPHQKRQKCFRNKARRTANLKRRSTNFVIY